MDCEREREREKERERERERVFEIRENIDSNRDITYHEYLGTDLVESYFFHQHEYDHLLLVWRQLSLRQDKSAEHL